MGHLCDGKWVEAGFPCDSEGNYRRPPSNFREKISSAPGARFRPEAGRYHLYVSYACPWAHRTLLMRKLKGLESVLPISVVDPHMDSKGWHFSEAPGCIPDPLFQARYLYEIYQRCDPRISARATVPVLWDKREGVIVNNESREIMRMLDTQFEELATTDAHFLPPGMEQEVEKRIDEIYEPVNNGVYRCGFAKNQGAYDRAARELFGKLEELDRWLSRHPYLCGEILTEADWCLFTTLIRFDLVYFFHFKCNQRPIQSYPNLWRFLNRLYNMPGVADTCHFDHIKTHYFWSHEDVNPHRIIPVGPEENWWEHPKEVRRFEGRYLRVWDMQGWEFVERSRSDGAVVMVPLTRTGKLVLVEQYRIPLGKKVLELPAGLINDLHGTDEEDWRQAAGRELLEETGYLAGSWRALTSGPPSPGLTNEQVTFALAQDLEKLGPGGGIDGEEIQVMEVELGEVENFLRDYQAKGGVVDPKIFAGLYFLAEKSA